MKIDPNKIKWVHVASRGKNHAVLLIDSIGTLSMQNKYPETLYDFPYTAKYYLQCNGSRHLAKNDVDAMINILHKRLRQQPDFFYHYGVKMKGLSLELREWIDEVKNTKWKQLDNTKIAKIIFKHCQLTAKIWAIPFNYAYYFFLNDIVIEQFIKDIKKRLGKNFEKQHIAILTPDKNSEIATERIALLKLALQTTKNKTVDKQKLEAHWKRFAHLNNYYYWGNGYSLDNMFDRLNEETKRAR